MSEPTFQIVFRGKILGGFDREQVRANLGRLFRIDATRVDALLDAPKTVLKTGLGKDAASRYQEALRDAGIMVAVIGETPPAALGPQVASPPSSQATTREIVPVAEAATSASGLTLAEPGVQLLPPQPRHKADIDTSALTLAQPGVILIERREVVAPQYDLSNMTLGDADEPIVPQHKPEPAAIDTSTLSLAEQPQEIEKPLTELQKLLMSSVE